MTKPPQRDLFPPRKPSPASMTATPSRETGRYTIEPFEFTGEGLDNPGSLDDVPPFLRFPDEPGYVELDRFMRPVAK